MNKGTKRGGSRGRCKEYERELAHVIESFIHIALMTAAPTVWSTTGTTNELSRSSL